MPIDPTPGGPAADAYLSVEDADAYFGARLNTSAWDAADVTTKETALKAATARLEQESYVGYRASSSQRLAWPRSGVCNDRQLVDSSIVPPRVTNAACEMALTLLNAGSTDLYAPTGLEGFEHIAVGDLDITPREDAPSPGALPVAVRRWLRDWLLTSSGTSKLVRG
jgi:hypothetical protein